MKRLLFAAAALAVVVARPETYREKEDFQYSRSSSDEGSKTGFYGAQRGNVGGNFERAHNMDSLAQNQMSGVVRQVEGEIGDGANTRTGSVYSAANSRGVYGSGHYDLSNLQGRNFQEGVSYGDSQAHLSSAYHQSSVATNSAYSDSQQSRQSGFDATGHANQLLQASNAQTADSDTTANRNDYNTNSEIYRQGYYTKSGYHSQRGSAYGQNSLPSSVYNSNARIISTRPVRVIVRPGTGVDIPVAAQTYDDSSNTNSLQDHHSANSDVEVLSNTDYQTRYETTERPKHFEASYNYRKEWERSGTSTLPIIIPTNSFPRNSELYDETQGHYNSNQYEASRQGTQSSSNVYRGYNSAASSRNQQQSESQHRLSSGIRSSAAYKGDLDNSRNLITGDADSKPKSYQSSYSYHKSWERQGDPYVIRPGSSDVLDSQASTLSNQNSQFSSEYNSNHRHSHQNYENSDVIDGDCDQNGHVRVARSTDLSDPQQHFYDGQYSQNYGDEIQQSQNIEHTSQQRQNLEDFGQQSQNLEDFGQQSQNLEDFGQQSQNLEDFGQQSQNLEDFGQQSQNLEHFGQQSKNLEDFSQQSQNLEDFGQQSQNLGDFGQQTQTLQGLGQQGNQFTDAEQQTQNQWDKITEFGQRSEQDLGQQTQDSWDKVESKPQEIFDQHIQNKCIDSKLLNEKFQCPSLIGTQRYNENSQTINTEQTPNKLLSEPIYGPAQISPQTDVVNNFDQPGSHQYHYQDNQYQNNWQHISQNEDVRQHNLHFGNNEPDYNIYTQNYNVMNTLRHNPLGYDYLGHNPVGLNPLEHHPLNVANGFYTRQPTPSLIQNIGPPRVFNNNWKNVRPFDNSQDQLSMNVWEKIDNIQKSSEISTNTGMGNSYNVNKNSNQTHSSSSINHNSDKMDVQYTNIQDIPHYSGYQPAQSSLADEDIHNSNIDYESHVSSLESVNKGRGDISSEDLPTDNQDTITNDDSKRDKTIEEIVAVSSVTDVNNTDTSVNTKESDTNANNKDVSKDDSHKTLSNRRDLLGLGSTDTPHGSMVISEIIPGHPVSQNNNTHQLDNHNLDKLFEIIRQQHNSNQQNIDTIAHYWQQNENINQQNMEQHFEGSEKKNLEQMVDFGQHNEGLNQQNMEQQYEGLSQQHENLNPENLEQMVDFGQKNEDLSQQNMEQQFEGLDQQHENLNKQNAEQIVDFGQQNKDLNQQNMEQQFQGLGQQHENLNKKNVDQLVDFGQKNEDLSQQNMEQQFVEQNFVKQNEHNHNANQNGPEQQFDHKEQNVNQQFEYTEKQNTNLNQSQTVQSNSELESNLHGTGKQSHDNMVKKKGPGEERDDIVYNVNAEQQNGKKSLPALHNQTDIAKSTEPEKKRPGLWKSIVSWFKG